MRISKLLLLAIVAFALIFSGCKKKNGSITIQVKARFNGQNVNLDTTTFQKNGGLYQFSAFKFYLSHITLVGTDGSTNELSAAQLFDFSIPSSLTLNFNNLKGDYKGIKFGCGLDSVLDNTNPNTVAASSPLSAANCGDMYWAMQLYRFEALDGKWNYVTDGSGTFLHGLSYHVGGLNYYRTSTLNNNFSVCCDKGTTLTLYVDVDKIFFGSSETISLPSESGTQTLPADNPAIANTFVDNFSQAFTF